MNGKTIGRIALALVVLLAIASLSGCELLSALFGGKALARVEAFESDLNRSDRSDIYRNFHPTETTQYEAMKIETYWDYAFPPSYDYDFTDIDVDDDNLGSGSATLVVTSGDGELYNSSVSFTFAEEGSDILIKTFSGFSATIYKLQPGLE